MHPFFGIAKGQLPNEPPATSEHAAFLSDLAEAHNGAASEPEEAADRAAQLLPGLSYVIASRSPFHRPASRFSPE